MKIERTIDLRPHVGFTREGRKVQHAQDMIYLNGLHVGYVGHLTGAAVNLIRPVDEATKEAIVQRVAELRGAAPQKVVEMPILTDEEQLDLAEGRRTASS